MKKHFVIAALLLLVACFLPSTCEAQQQLQGNWVGGFLHRGNWVRLNITLASEQGKISGSANITFTDYENQNGVALTALTFNGARAHFELQTRFGNMIFEGRLSGPTIAGTYRYKGQTGAFGITKTTAVPPDQRAKLFGAYQAGRGRVISICEWDGTRLRFVDFNSGQHHSLYALSEETFFSGPGQAVSYPITLKVRFVKDSNGDVTQLRWTSNDGKEQTANKIKFIEEELSFKNGDITLGGTLITPATKGPHPVIILTPGDFGSSRHALRFYAYNYLRRGIAGFVFDSRGAGGSTGPVASSSFNDLAGDVLAGVELLKTRPNVNPKQIGVFGFSNSAWTVTLAASRSKSVAFLIAQSGSALAPWQQESFRAERQVQLAGFPEDAVENAAAMMKLKFEVARTGQGWDQLQAMIAKHRDEGWVPYTNPSRSLERLRGYWERSFSYDPAPAFERVTCPALFPFGALDSFIPVQASIPIIERGLRRAGNKDFTIKVFPRGRHDLVEGENGGDREAARMRRFAVGYWNFTAEWLRKRVTISGQ